MKNQNINIHKASNIKAIGDYNSRHTKAVVCKETGDVFSSVADAAAVAGVHYTMMSGHLCGRYKSVKKLHYDYLDNVLDNPNEILTQLRKASSTAVEVVAKAKVDADDARKWREYQAQLKKEADAKAKAEAAAAKKEAKKQAKIEKLKAAHIKLTNECAKDEEKLQKKVAKMMDVEAKLAALVGKDEIAA